MAITLHTVLIVVAIVLFLLAAFGVPKGVTISLGWLGLAVYVAAALV